MLMPLDPIDTCVVYASERRTDSCYETEKPATASPLSRLSNAGVVHEEADSGMPRVPIRRTVRARSNLSDVYRHGVGGQEGEGSVNEENGTQ